MSDTAKFPATWTDKDYRWQVKLPGSGHSSPVVWGDRVYVTATDDDASQVVCCLNTVDGTTVWAKKLASKPHHINDFNSFAASTPTVDKDRLYVCWATPNTYILAAMDRHTGDEVWRRDFGPFVAEHGFGASPILFENMVIVSNEQNQNSSVIAVNSATGEIRWTAPRRNVKAAYSTPILYRPEGGQPQLILTSWAHGISSLDPRNGKTVWELPVLTYRTVGSPIVAAGLIFAAAGEGGGGKQMFAARPGDPAKRIEAKVAYEVQGKLPYVVTPIAQGNLLFLWSDQGIVSCLDAPTGKRLWQQRVGGKYFSSPVRVGDHIYCISREGEVVVLAASDHYQLLGRVKLGEPSHSTPAISGGIMYLRTESRLMALPGK